MLNTSKSQLLSEQFYVNAAVRAVKTYAQAAVALLIGAQVGLLDVNWTSVASVAGMAAVVSVLTSISSADQIVPPAVPLIAVDGKKVNPTKDAEVIP